ncbi:DUF4437 domain-containing protein [Actinophytocola sp.]|uniref:DUF4437 domain-containing protein n=1 Tax=Actinophytocola sp. TaxID=1872138 RepID=UPI003899EEB8
MGRPFIEFIQAQALPWRRDTVPGRHSVETRELSADVDTGAASLLLRYPPGWRTVEPTVLSMDEELFVLAGDLTIGAIRHTRYGYAHLPAGYHRDGMASASGAIVLTFFSGLPTAAADRDRLVERRSALDGTWSGNFHPRFPPGAGRKFLRQDPHNGEETWLLGTMPLRNGQRPERHPVVEEMYLLSGELIGPVGVMRPGAYFWRPPHEWHGPFGTLTGNLMLFRTKGGPLSTTYTEHETHFTWSPDHHPILPDHLRRYGTPTASTTAY